MDKRFLPIILSALLLLSSACVNEEQPTAEQVRDRSTAAMKLVETYVFDMDTSMAMTGTTADSGQKTAAMGIVAGGKVDVKAKKMFINASVSMLGMKMSMEQYVIGDVMYMKAPLVGWVKNKTDSSLWDKQNYAKVSEDMMFGSVRLSGEEVVDGVSCRILDVDMDPEKMLEAMGGSQMGSSALTAEDLEAVKEASVREWVETDSYRIKKMAMSMRMEKDGSTADLNMTMKFSDYNKPMDITLPPEAEGAVDMEALSGGL